MDEYDSSLSRALQWHEHDGLGPRCEFTKTLIKIINLNFND